MKQSMKRITTLLLAFAMLLAFMPSIPAYADDSVKEITVNVLTQNEKNTLLRAFNNLKVKSNAAEECGYTEPSTRGDGVSLEGEVTSLDVLVTAMKEIYGKDFTSSPTDYLVVNTAGTITKIFGNTTTLSGFIINGENPTYTDGKTGSLVNESIVDEGDSLRFYRTFADEYGTDGLMESALFFEDDQDQFTYSPIEDGGELKVKVMVNYAFAKMMNMPSTTEPAEDAVVSLKKVGGGDVIKATSDETGTAVFNGIPEGDYEIVVSEYDNDLDDAFVTPYAKLSVWKGHVITVTPAVRNYEKANKFDIIPQEITVSSDTAEKHGDFGDLEAGNNGKVTVADMLYTLHEMKFGKLEGDRITDYLVMTGGWITKCFGVETSNQVYIPNRNLSMSGSTYTTVLEDGDTYDHFMNRDGWNDIPTAYKESEKKVKEGQAFELSLLRMNWDGSSVALPKADKEEVVAALIDKDGNLSPIDGTTMDKNGTIKLTLNKSGTYLVSATGKAVAEYASSAAIVPPYCKVTVLPADKTPVKPSTPAPKKVPTVTVKAKTVDAKTVAEAVKKAGGSVDSVTSFVLDKKVKKIKKGTFSQYKNLTTLTVKTKKLKKKSVKGSMKGSSIKTIKVQVGKKKTNKKYVKKYKKIFTKKNAGKKVKVTM